jgi:hypothetical protein
MAGCGGSTTSSNATATPSFSPGGITYNSSQMVTISSVTSGAVLCGTSTISGATVQLFVAGTSGYGAAPRPSAAYRQP